MVTFSNTFVKQKTLLGVKPKSVPMATVDETPSLQPVPDTAAPVVQPAVGMLLSISRQLLELSVTLPNFLMAQRLRPRAVFSYALAGLTLSGLITGMWFLGSHLTGTGNRMGDLTWNVVSAGLANKMGILLL